MELEQQTHGAWLGLTMRGRLDATNAREADAQLDEIVRSGAHHIRTNMAGVDYLSSAGIRVLVRQRQQLEKLGGVFCVVAPSEQVRTVLELTGLGQLIDDAAAHEAVAEDKAAGAAVEHACMRIEVFPPETPSRLEGFILGGAADLEKANNTVPLHSLRLTGDTLAVGIGAFGATADEARPRLGEFMAVKGAGICLPGDGSAEPDFMLAQGGLVPEVQALYALGARGTPDHCLRFETMPDEEGVPLSALAELALEHTNGDMAAVCMLAETAGLVGAWLRKSPAEGKGGGFFDHPGIRERLAFAPERMHSRSLALVAGVAARADVGVLGDLIRPLEPDAALYGHFHATVFTFRVLPHGPFDLGRMLATLFEEEMATGLMHLLHDARPYAGGGESLFVRGALWAGALDRPAQVEGGGA